MAGYGTTRTGTIRFLPPDETGLLNDHEGYTRAYGETLIVTINGVTQSLGEWLTDANFLQQVLLGLPTTLPAQAGVLWLNGGVVCVS